MKALFLGDICPTDYSSPYFKEKDISKLFGDSESIFKDRDFIFANLECAITKSENQIKKFGPNLKAPYETAEVLNKIGVTLLTETSVV